jgi:hypoxanthine phosphoribosyltransferase
MAVSKTFISPETLYRQSFELGKKVYDSGFRPNWIVALWRGGCPVGMCVQEFLEYKGVKTEHIAVRTSGYRGIGEVKIFAPDYVAQNVTSGDRLLIVDDIFDTGGTVKAVIDVIRERTKDRCPARGGRSHDRRDRREQGRRRCETLCVSCETVL